MTLRQAAFSGTRWSTLAAVFRVSAQVVQTSVLARMLAPSDFGLMAIAGSITAVAALFADLGISSALMHFPRPDRRTFSTLYWLNLGAASALFLLFLLLAYPLSSLYRKPQLFFVVALLGLMFPLSAAGQPYRVLAEKDLRFASLARQEVVASLLALCVAILCALCGAGVFALVVAALTGAACNSALAWARLSDGLLPHRDLSLQLARPFLSFGLHRLGDGIWNALRLHADVFISGLFASPAAVAYYAAPREQCLRLANSIVNPVVTRIGLPVMTRLQNDRTALRAVYLQTLGMTASLNFPAYAFIALFPAEIVALLFGKQWGEAAFYLRVFALWGLVRSTGNPSGSLLYAVGMVRRAHLWNFLNFVVVVPLLWGAARTGGLAGLAWTMLILQLIIFLLAWRHLIHPACGASLKEYTLQLLPAFTASLLAATAAAAAFRLEGLSRLLAGGFILSAVYLTLSLWLNRRWIMGIVELLYPAYPGLRRR
jgi:O-antigen/teichoic acid export membrane protein